MDSVKEMLDNGDISGAIRELEAMLKAQGGAHPNDGGAGQGGQDPTPPGNPHPSN